MPTIAREYNAMVDEHVGRIRAEVTSARPLSPDEVQRLTGALAEQTQKKVILTQKTDSELLGGMVTRVGSIIYDGTIRTQLEQMRQALLA